MPLYEYRTPHARGSIDFRPASPGRGKNRALIDSLWTSRKRRLFLTQRGSGCTHCRCLLKPNYRPSRSGAGGPIHAVSGTYPPFSRQGDVPAETAGQASGSLPLAFSAFFEAFENSLLTLFAFFSSLFAFFSSFLTLLAFMRLCSFPSLGPLFPGGTVRE